MSTPLSQARGSAATKREVRYEKRDEGDGTVTGCGSRCFVPVRAVASGLERDACRKKRKQRPWRLLDRHGEPKQHRTSPRSRPSRPCEAIPSDDRADQQWYEKGVGDSADRVADVDTQLPTTIARGLTLRGRKAKASTTPTAQAATLIATATWKTTRP